MRIASWLQTSDSGDSARAEGAAEGGGRPPHHPMPATIGVSSAALGDPARKAAVVGFLSSAGFHKSGHRSLRSTGTDLRTARLSTLSCEPAGTLSHNPESPADGAVHLHIYSHPG
eukprot:5684112-Pyramimonas_sp.AAC.1